MMKIYYPGQNIRPQENTLASILGMASVIIALTFPGSLARANEADIRQEVLEKKDKSGNVVGRVEKTFRGSELIMETDFRRDPNGRLTLDSRMFYVNGYLAMVENKSNPSNASLDALTVYRCDTNFAPAGIEMFTRQADGSVKPVSTEAQRQYEKEVKASMIASQMIGGSATNRIKETILSPDKRLKAVVFSRDYGALGAFNRQIVVVDNAQANIDYDADKVLLSVTADGDASKFLSQVRAYWVSSQELHISYPVGSSMRGPRVAVTNAPTQAIKIVYEPYELK